MTGLKNRLWSGRFRT